MSFYVNVLNLPHEAVKTIVLGFLLGGLLYGCSSDSVLLTPMDTDLKAAIRRASPDGTVAFYVLPDERDFHLIPQEPKNPLNSAKVALGKMLFFEPGLGLESMHEEGRETYSCASCHLPSAGFKPGATQGVADGGMGMGLNGEMRVKNPIYADEELDVQGIRPLSVMNVAFVQNTLWNGQFGGTHANASLSHLFGTHLSETILNREGMLGLETQNIEGLRLHRMVIDRENMERLGYRDLFDQAFPELAEDIRYTRRTGSFAISAYLRTLIANEAPFQDWLKGDYSAMTEQEKRGGTLFFDKARCATCHSEKNLGANQFFALGVNDMDMIPSYARDPHSKKNLGRGGFTNREEDMFKFKVPQLYNVDDNPFFFHGSSMNTLEEVIDYKDQAVKENPRVPDDAMSTNRFYPIGLSADEKADLIAFLRGALRDPNLQRYAPTAVRSGLCFPNNDIISQQDMGCQ